MRSFFTIRQTDYEQYRLFEHQIFRIENITGMTITDFEIIYFFSYEEINDEHLEQFREVELHILVPNKNSINGKQQYKSIHFTTYQDSYEHYDLTIKYKYLSKEEIEDMKKVY